MTRAWDELAAAVFDVVPPGVLLLLMLLAAGLVATLWYWFPAWVPRRLPRWRLRLRLPKRRKKKPVQAGPEPVEPEPEPVITLPDPAEAPAAAGAMSLADRLAAEGRYAEAIRQRLRDAVGELVAARIVAPQPGWTAAELAAAAARQRPAVARPLGQATELFSEIWYGDRPAYRDHDEHMRTLTEQVRTVSR